VVCTANNEEEYQYMTSAREKLSKINVAVNPEYLKRRNKFFIKLENFIYRHKNKLVFIHAALFLLFLVLIALPLFLPQPAEQATAFTNFSLFSQFLLWGIWFPLVFVSVLFTGRSWCGILCPMGAASEWATKIGLQYKIPNWLKWDGTPILSFLLVTILGQTVDVRDQATAIAEIFGGTLVLALLIGFFYGKQKKRAWCRHVCPIGLLLGIFSRLGIVQFAAKQLQMGGDRYTEKGICPTMISINHKQESRHCIQCFRCVKPTSKGGLFVKLRRFGEEIIQIREHSPSLGEVWFIFLSTGISLGGFLWLILPSYQSLRQTIGEWLIEQGWLWIGNSGPGWLMSVHPELRQTYNWLDFFMIVAFMLTCMLLVTIVLSVCTLASSYLAGLFHADKTLKDRFIELGYQFAPVAMISIIIGLGDTLFSTLHHTLKINNSSLSAIKIVLITSSIIWSIYLGKCLLLRQNVNGIKNWIALIPGILGSLFVGIAWWPAIFGVNFSLLEQYRQQLIFLN
jgi:hypothetical protein